MRAPYWLGACGGVAPPLFRLYTRPIKPKIHAISFPAASYSWCCAEFWDLDVLAFLATEVTPASRILSSQVSLHPCTETDGVPLASGFVPAVLALQTAACVNPWTSTTARHEATPLPTPFPNLEGPAGCPPVCAKRAASGSPLC